MSLNILLSLLLLVILIPLCGALFWACRQMTSPSAQSPTRLRERPRNAAVPYAPSSGRFGVNPEASDRTSRS